MEAERPASGKLLAELRCSTGGGERWNFQDFMLWRLSDETLADSLPWGEAGCVTGSPAAESECRCALSSGGKLLDFKKQQKDDPVVGF